MDLNNMFADLDLNMGLSAAATERKATTVSAPSIKKEEPEKSAKKDAFEVEGFVLDDLDRTLAELESKWKNEFEVGDEVDAIWDEDGMWYVGVVDSVEKEEKMYVVTFVEYGNTQKTHQDKMRATVNTMMRRAERKLGAEMERRRVIASALNRLSQERSSLGVQMSKGFDSLISDGTSQAGKDSSSKPSNIMSNGVMTAEERKALIMQEAKKLGLSTMTTATERQMVPVGALESPKPKVLSGGRKSNDSEEDKKTGLFGRNRTSTAKKKNSSSSISASASGDIPMKRSSSAEKKNSSVSTPLPSAANSGDMAPLKRSSSAGTISKKDTLK